MVFIGFIRRMQRFKLLWIFLTTSLVFIGISWYTSRVQRLLLEELLNDETDRDSPRRLKRPYAGKYRALKGFTGNPIFFTKNLPTTTPSTTERPRSGPGTDFVFKHGEKFCQERTKDTSTILSVHSSPPHFANRKTIRETWGSKRWQAEYQFALFFVVGNTTDAAVQTKLDEESKNFGDIVQYDYVDAYYNMTYKSLAELKFVARFCMDSPFTNFGKVDDDMFINVKHVTQFLDAKDRTKTIICEHVRYNEPVLHDKGNKWYVPWEMYPHKSYPVYCAGTFYSFTRDLVEPLIHAAQFVPFFWIDDVYITGMLPKRIGNVSHVNVPRQNTPTFIHTAQNLDFIRKEYDKYFGVTEANLTVTPIVKADTEESPV